MKDLVSLLRRHLRLLPLLVVVSCLTFVVRIGDAALQFRALSGAAYAEDAAKPATEAKPAETAAAEPAKTNEKKEGEAAATGVPEVPGKPAAPGEKPAEVDKAAAKSPEWTDAADTDIDYSTLRKELYQDLLQRRQQLDSKEKALGEREALLEAGEKELQRKYDELTGLRNEIQDLLKKQSDEEDARIASLVKIYEGMKPKDAARIFNTLDMDIMIDVVGRMSERKSAPIIAAMDAERAKSLTTLLAEQKKLPELPDGTVPPPAQ